MVVFINDDWRNNRRYMACILVGQEKRLDPQENGLMNWAGDLMIVNEIVHILVAPPDILETALAKEAAEILNIDSYATHLLLSGKIPKLIGRYQSIAEAELIVKRLKTLGLVAIVLKDSELAESSVTRFRAHALKSGNSEVIFFDKGGQQNKLESKDVFLILKGKQQLSNEKDVTITSLKFNLTATVMTGGIPIWRKVKETIKGNLNEAGYFVRIYDPISTEPRVEFFENYFDFSSLGAKIAPSSSINLDSIITELRTVFPQARFDDRLTQPGTSMSSDKPVRDLELNCKFIYLYHQTVSISGQL